MRQFEISTSLAIVPTRRYEVTLRVKYSILIILLGMLRSVMVVLTVFTCYWPLSQYTHQLVVHSLDGGD